MHMSFSKTSYAALLIVVLIDILLIDLLECLTDNAVKTPYTEDQDCPRKPGLIGNRKCLKKCRADTDCRGRNKRCMCDDVCGKSCVKPTLRCEPLKPIFHGKYEITPFNTFGARVRYSCLEGYILSGATEGICQGDTYWSMEPPTCETEGKCRDPPQVTKASHDGPEGHTVFPLGTQLTYTCKSGYNMDGFFRAMCVGEGRWVGPRMTCSPERCGHPGEIQNGRREGDVFMFPNRVTFVCNHGYELVGRSYRVCQADGQWSEDSPPTCQPIKCPQLVVPPNGERRGSVSTFGSSVHFECFRGFRLVGSRTRRCEQNGHWSGTEATCTMVDCGMPGPFYNGYLDGQQTTFGAVMIYRCFGRTTFQGNQTSTACLENGEWSTPVPKCWSKCKIPSISHGTVDGKIVGEYVRHQTSVTVSCNGTHEPNTTAEALCNNGTWSSMPSCVPAPCKVRPYEIPNGIMRFHGMQHGNKAKYHCNTGYKLLQGPSEGGEIDKGGGSRHNAQPDFAFRTCLFGRWEGATPKCTKVFCTYPGMIDHGMVMLIGAIGKYEYRDYVNKIGHNEQIEFKCDPGYKRVGPSAATCVDGMWSPREKAECVPGQHPKMLYLYRGKRDVSQKSRSTKIFNKHRHLRSISAEEVNCENPGVLDNGRIFIIGNYGNFLNRPYVKIFEDERRIEFECNSDYRLVGINSSTCKEGRWTPPDKPACVLDV